MPINYAIKEWKGAKPHVTKICASSLMISICFKRLYSIYKCTTLMIELYLWQFIDMTSETIQLLLSVN